MKNELFPFKDPIPLLEGNFIPAMKAHEILFPLLTPTRKEKIRKVVQSRIFTHGVILEDVYDQGNTSAVLRSAEGFGLGIAHIVETKHRFKSSQRTTAGADKWIEITKWNSTDVCLDHLENQGYQICVTSLGEESKEISQIDWSQPSMIVIGNEKEGVSKVMKERASKIIHIPMYGFVQSYNLSVAAAICFYQIRQSITNCLPLHEEMIASTSENINTESNSIWLTAYQKMVVETYYYMRTLDSARKILEYERRKHEINKEK